MSRTLNVKKSKPSARAAFVARKMNELTTTTTTTNAGLNDSTFDSNESFEFEPSKTTKKEKKISNFASINKFGVLLPGNNSIKNSVAIDDETMQLLDSLELENFDVSDDWHLAASKNSDGKSLEIAALCDYLKQMFEFRWGCSKNLFACRYGERVIAQHGTHRDCSANLLLCHPLGEKGNWLVKVRIPNDKPPENWVQSLREYKICESLNDDVDCPTGDVCLYGHSPEEVTIWNTIHYSNLTFPAVYAMIKGSKCLPENSRLMPKNNPPFVQPSTSTNSNKQHHEKAPFVPSKSANFANTEDGFGKKTEPPPTLEVVDMKRLSTLFVSHKFHLACLNCHIITTNDVVLLPHRCTQNVLLCRENNSNQQWKRVRPRPTTNVRPNITAFPTCRDFPRCPRSIRCTSAHSDLERLIWNTELKNKEVLIPANLADNLLHSLVLQSDRRLELPSIGQIYVWVGCNDCITLVNKGYHQVFKFKHTCNKDFVLFRDVLWKHAFWNVIRPRSVSGHAPDMCPRVDKNDCRQLKSCKFAHSDLEFRLWTLDEDHKRRLRQLDLTEILQIELDNWSENEPIYKIITAKPASKFVASPPSGVLFQNGGGGGEGYDGCVGSDRKRKRRSPTECEPITSPFKVHYVCGTCFCRYSLVKYQQSGTLKCENKRESHIWEIHKQLTIFDDAGKGHKLRPLPAFLLISNWKSCSICKIIATGKTCNRSVCNYAHSEIEKRCWTFLLRNGKDVYDIVTEPTVEAAAPVRENRTLMPTKSNDSCAIPMHAVWGMTQNNPYVEIEAMKGLHDNALYCFLCDKKYPNETKFEEHCFTVEHDEKLDVDQRRDWACRPPRGVPPYKLCKNSSNFCAEAHSFEELDEWNERIMFLQEELRRKPNDIYYAIKERILKNTKAKSDLLMDTVGYATIALNGSKVVRTDDRGKKFHWIFEINSERPLRRVALMDKQFLYYFRFISPFRGNVDSQACSGDAFLDTSVEGYYEVKVEFMGSKSLGTFSQEVIFDFGDDVPMVHNVLTVHVGITENELNQLSHMSKLLTSDDFWSAETVEIHWISKQRYQKIINPTDVVCNLQLKLNEQTYFKTMRKLIMAEEMRRQSILASFRLKGEASLELQLPTEEGDRLIFPKHEESVFAKVPLDVELSEDFDLADLLIGDCEYAFVAVPNNMDAKSQSGKRHVAEVEVVGRNNYRFQGFNQDCVYLSLSASFVRYFRLKPGDSLPIEVQFNLTHEQFASWISCLDKLAQKEMAQFVFPNLISCFNHYLTGQVKEEAKQKIPQLVYLEKKWSASKQNEEQIKVLRHVVTCAVNKTHWIPPLVIYGPFGTGKTRTLAEAVITLLQQPHLHDTKILICTQSNSTAHLYLELLEEHGGFKPESLQPLVWRVVSNRAKWESLPPFVKPYVRYNETDGFEQLTLETLKKLRVVICTVNLVQRCLNRLIDANPDSSNHFTFTHIFLDEAGQGMEVEMLQPLCVASKKTCVVVAGDHHQIRPTVYFSEAEELQYTYLERLYSCYSSQEAMISDTARPSCCIPKILFSKNYRCHADILSFLSESFYEGESELQSCAVIPQSDLKPMYFAAAIGKEVIAPGSISFNNKAELEEVLWQVRFFWNNWPASWGDKDIGIVVNSFDQVKFITERMKEERVPRNHYEVGKTIMMQGKEFKVLIVSTVRGRNLLDRPLSDRRKLGFLDDARLINTALTRARYSVVVVGDPVVLCSIGKCKNIWRRYVDICFDKKSFMPENYTDEQLKAEILINEARLSDSSNVDSSILKLAEEAIRKMTTM